MVSTGVMLPRTPHLTSYYHCHPQESRSGMFIMAKERMLLLGWILLQLIFWVGFFVCF